MRLRSMLPKQFEVQRLIPEVATFGVDCTMLDPVRAVLRRNFRVRQFTNSEDIRSSAVGVHPIYLVVIAPYADEANSTAERIRQLKQTDPTLQIVVYARAGDVSAYDGFAYAKAGALSLVMDGEVSLAHRIHDLMAKMDRSTFWRLLVSRCTRNHAHTFASIVKWATTENAISLTVEAAALNLRCSRRTLLSRLSSEAEGASPHAVLAWCKLILAFKRVEIDGLSIECAAAELGYEGMGKFASVVRRLTRTQLSDLLKVGATVRTMHLICRSTSAPPA